MRGQHAVATFTAYACRQRVRPTFTALDRRARRVALGYADGTVEVRDADRTGAVTLEKPHLVTGNALVSFAGDALLVSTDSITNPAELLVVAPDGSVHRLWHAPANRRIGAFATSGESVAVGLDDGSLLVWGLCAATSTVSSTSAPSRRGGSRSAATGTRLVVGDGGGRLHVVDGSGAALRQVRDPITTDHGPVLQVGFSDANRVIAVSPILVSYVDLATGNMLAANVAPTYWSSLVTVTHGFITVDPDGRDAALAARPAVPALQAVPGSQGGGTSRTLESYLAGALPSSTCPAAS